MIGKVLGLVLALLVVQNGKCEDPPVMKDSFIAWGEIVQPFEGTDNQVDLQTTFEESYDAETQNAAFQLWLWGKNLTFVKNFKTNQTFAYMETDQKKRECKETTEKEWMVEDLAPGLLAFEDDDGTIKFSLTQLFNLPKKFLIEKFQGAATVYRGIPAKSWTYEIRTNKKDDEKYDHTFSITSYWSDGKWNTSAGKGVTPLGFNVSKITWSEPVLVEDYVISVFGFVPNAYDHKFFEPIQGIVCETRKPTLKFPTVKDIRSISLHSEMALPDYQELRYIDAWIDNTIDVTRFDVERMKDENPMERKNKHYQSEISLGRIGVVFRWGYYKGEAECEVIPFNDYENDMQNFFDLKQRRMLAGKLFGLNDTSYVYIGKTTKNDLPCHLFQGKRTDWPDKNSKVTSLWEWCFNVNMSKPNDVVMFQEDEFGLISADVTILSHPNADFNNFQLRHHFYEVKAQDPNVLDLSIFDIGRCFQDTEKKLLQFYLDVGISEDNRHLYENATSDVIFLRRWKNVIYQYTGLNDDTLRISNVRATIDDGRLYIKFAILPVHKNLPEEVRKKERSVFDAQRFLRDDVNDGKVSIMYSFSKGSKAIKLSAAKHSVSLQIDPKFEPQTLPPPPPTTTTSTTRFTLRTVPTKKGKTSSTDSVPDDRTNSVTDSVGKSTSPDGTWTTSPPKPRIVKKKFIGHKSGSVAGVSIAMLAAGITIGAFGTFYKFNGMPKCTTQ